MEDIETKEHDTPVLTYCRKLIKKGTDPNEVLEVYRGGVMAIRVNRIGKGAKLTVDQRTTKFTRYRPMPDSLKTYYGGLPD